MGQMTSSVCIGLLIALHAAGPAQGAGPSPAVPAEEKALLEIIEPTQGRPMIIRPDQNFYFMFWTESPEVEKIVVSLEHCLSGQERVPLAAPVRPYQIQNAYWVMLLKVPALAKSGVYDLFIDLGRYYQRVPRAIKIVTEPKSRFRFVQLSNMNVGEPTAPDFDDRLVEEINLLCPEFILATGDFIDRAAPGTPADQWQRIKSFFRRFHAPCYILCGDQEEFAVFQKQVDPRPVWSFDYGPYHFVLIPDTQMNPINQHRSNIEAVLDNLRQARTAAMSFLVGRGENLRIIDGLKELGEQPADVFRRHKIAMILCGGSVDWDLAEYAEKLRLVEAAGVKYVRTGQSSTSMKNGGSGQSRYRVFEVDGSAVDCVYPQEPLGAAQYSIPAGRIRCFHDGPNDGSRPTERVSIVNALNQSFSDAQVILRLKGGDPALVKAANCRLEQVLKGPEHLIVLVRLDLPKNSAVQILASTDEAEFSRYEKIPVGFTLGGSKEIHLEEKRSPDGLVYLQSTEPLKLSVKNLSSQDVAVTLQARLAGQAIMLADPAATTQGSAATFAASAAATKELSLAGGASQELLIWPVLRTASPGEDYLAVYVMNDPLQRVWVDKVTVAMPKK